MIEEQQCPECHGAGLVHTDNGFTWMEEKCERCDGSGVVKRPFGDEKLTRKELDYD